MEGRLWYGVESLTFQILPRYLSHRFNTRIIRFIILGKGTWDLNSCSKVSKSPLQTPLLLGQFMVVNDCISF